MAPLSKNLVHDRVASLKPDPICDQDWSFFSHTKRCYKVENFKSKFALKSAIQIVANYMDCVQNEAQEATIHDKKTNIFIGGKNSD